MGVVLRISGPRARRVGCFVLTSLTFLPTTVALSLSAETPQTQPAPASAAAPATSRWQRKAEMPTARLRAVAVAVGARVFVIGGYTQTGETAQEPETRAVEAYDTAADHWTAHDPAPLAAYGAAVVGEKVFAFGKPDCYELDPSTQVWRRRAAMPTARDAFGTAVVGGKIYVIGGIVPDPKRKWGWGNTDVVEEYDPQTDSWRTRAPMFTPRHQPAVAVVTDKVHVIAGAVSFPDDYDRDGDRVEVYDPASDRWTITASTPMPIAYFTAFEAKGRILTMPGSNPRGQILEYEPSRLRWRALDEPVPTSRWQTAAAMVDGKIYVFGGIERRPGAWSGRTGLAVTEVYTPAEPSNPPERQK